MRLATMLALIFGVLQMDRSQPPIITTSLPGFNGPIRLDTGGTIRPLSARRADVFRATRAAFEALRIPIEQFDSTRGYLVNLEFTRMRTLAGHRMSELLNCGMGFSGPNADDFRVTLAFAALVEGDSVQSRLRIALAAGARSVEGASKPSVPCATTGVLESRLYQFVTNRLRSG